MTPQRRHYASIKTIAPDFSLTPKALTKILVVLGLKEHRSPATVAKAGGFVRFYGHLKHLPFNSRWRWDVEKVSLVLQATGHKRVSDREAYLQAKGKAA